MNESRCYIIAVVVIITGIAAGISTMNVDVQTILQFCCLLVVMVLLGSVIIRIGASIPPIWKETK